MKRKLFVLFTIYSLSVVPSRLGAAESQTWKVRPGDNLEIIATTLDIPREEIKQTNPGLSENNLRIGQKLNLPLRSHRESNALEEELRKKDAWIGELETNTRDLEQQIAGAESRLRWQPFWFWGFWLFLGILTFIASGACWIFRQTHPRVFDEPHERSIRDLKESQIRARPEFPHEEEGQRTPGGWHPSLRRLPHPR
jgi:LysM domain-containing protein